MNQRPGGDQLEGDIEFFRLTRKKKIARSEGAKVWVVVVVVVCGGEYVSLREEFFCRIIFTPSGFW
jgi:hypothetical protein